MKDNEYFENLTKEDIEKHKEDARKAYGNYNDKTKNWPTTKFKEVLKEGEVLSQKLVEKMDAKLPVSDVSVQEIIADHHKYMNNFWDCTYEAYANLGKMYIEDDRFKKNIDSAKEGLAQYFCDAMQYYVEQHI